MLGDPAEEAYWGERETNDVGPFQASVEESNRDLSKHAILGLALAGTPEAAEALRNLVETEATGQQAILEDNNLDTIREAIATNEQIANVGLVEYYRNAGE